MAGQCLLCDRKAHARQMCNTHYSRWLKSTPPEAHPTPEPDPAVRYQSKIATGKRDECWPWTAGRDPDGYGIFHAGKPLRAHRYGWELVNGSIPAGLVIRHSCDNPPCQNLAHMSLGTNRENVADMIERNRHARVAGGTRKLSNQQVAEILNRLTGRRGQQKELAKEYGVSRSLINMIAKRGYRSNAAGHAPIPPL